MDTPNSTVATAEVIAVANEFVVELSTVPGLAALIAAFGLAQLVWFIGVGVALRRP